MNQSTTAQQEHQQPLYAPAPPTNAFAVLSLVFAFLFWPLAIVFGHVGRKQIARTGESGRGLATAGMAIGYLGMSFVVLMMVLFAAAGASATAASAPQAPVALLPVSEGAVPARAAAAPAMPVGPVTSFGDGKYVVGEDIEPGTYKTAGAEDGVFRYCYWERQKNTDGDFNSIITNGGGDGPTTVTIKNSDGAFQTQGCKTWQKVR